MTYQLTIDDYIGRWCYSKQYVRNQLSAYKGKHVDVKISSLGGDLDHGLDIRQQFLDHGDVTVHLSGFVASSATVIAMGAKHVVMSKYAMFLVHKCSNFIDAWGSYNADQMQKLIDDLTANKKENDKIDVVLANMYAARCHRKVSEILDVLKEGRWLSAQEALDYGFIDEISEDDDGAKTNLTPELSAKLNAIGYSTAGLDCDCHESQSSGIMTRLVNSIFGESSPAPQNSNQSDKTEMKKKNFSFSAVENLIEMKSITPDSDNDVTVTADQMQAINDRLDSLEKSAQEKDDIISKRDNEIKTLKAQIEALKDAPGDETGDIEDEAGDSVDFKAADMYNHLKGII